jgi:hypothetical protein
MADPDRIAQAHRVLAERGVGLADLQADAESLVPTLGEYLLKVVAAAGLEGGSPQDRPLTRGGCPRCHRRSD